MVHCNIIPMHPTNYKRLDVSRDSYIYDKKMRMLLRLSALIVPRQIGLSYCNNAFKTLLFLRCGIREVNEILLFL